MLSGCLYNTNKDLLRERRIDRDDESIKANQINLLVSQCFQMVEE